MIEIKNLSKRYGSKVALDNISFTVDRGEILGFLGPNGAGKTTTMNIITGYISSSEGSVKIDGYDVLENPIEVKKRIGYLPEQPPLYLDLTVDEYLNFVYELKKVKLDRKQHLSTIKELVKITDVSKRKIKNLSKGYRQRVGLAQALIGNPEVLILDEPTVGLDPKQIIEMRILIKELGKDHTIILSSHILPEVSAVCERVIIINKGKIVAIDTPENLAKTISGNRSLVIRVGAAPEYVLPVLRHIEGVESAELQAEHEGGEYDYIVTSSSDIRKEISLALAANQLPILLMTSSNSSLEDIFLALTSDEASRSAEEEYTQSETSAETEGASEAEENYAQSEIVSEAEGEIGADLGMVAEDSADEEAVGEEENK